MIAAQIRRPFQRTDKRGQMPRKLRNLIPFPGRIIGPRVISHIRSLSPRSQPARSPSPYAGDPDSADQICKQSGWGRRVLATIRYLES